MTDIAHPEKSAPSLLSSARRLLGMERRATLMRAMAHGPLSGTDGPLIGFAGHRPIRLRPGHSLLTVSPPGTGRIAGLTVPALITDVSSSYVVHDDGQVLEMTSGWRASLGRVAVLNLDGPSPDAINPFDPAWLPENPRHVDAHALRVMRQMLPEHPKEALILSGVAHGLIRESGGTTLKAVFERALGAGNPEFRSAAALLSPILGSVPDDALSHNTIVPSDLRGDPETSRPFTLYIVRDRIGGSHRMAIAAIVQELIWRHALSYGPGETTRSGAKTGPTPLFVVIDDLNALPRLDGLVRALDLQRAKNLGSIVVITSGGSLVERYGSQVLQDLVSCCGVRLVTVQSNPDDLRLVDPRQEIGFTMASGIDGEDSYAVTQFGEPIRMRRPFFFKDASLKSRVYEPRTRRGPKSVAWTERKEGIGSA